MFTSDMEFHGIDYPAVTHILHFSLPYSLEHFANYRLRQIKRLGSVGITYFISDWEYETLYPSVFEKFPTPDTMECFPEDDDYDQMKEKIDANDLRLLKVRWLWAFWSMVRFFNKFEGVDKASLAREMTSLFTDGMGRSSQELELDRKVAEQFGLIDIPGLF